MADVTTEALQTVKNALSTFQTDISGLSMRAISDADDITKECKSQINLTKTEIMQVETQIATLNKQIYCRNKFILYFEQNARHTSFDIS